MIDRAVNDAEAIAISARFISEPAQEFGALGRQGERHRNHCCFDGASAICTTKLFLSPVSGLRLSGVASAEADDPRFEPAMDASVARNSDSRAAGRSTSTLTRPASGTPLVAAPPS